jgi:[acyl-carrier-protein] S-malonyltransferase
MRGTGWNVKCLIFSGQGTSLRGSAPADLFEEFADFTEEADAILGYSIAKMCLDDRDERLQDTRYAQPAIYFVNALQALRRTRADDVKYHFFAGHSLGEYNALVAAGSIDLCTGLRLVTERSRLMSQVRGGGMAAVIGLPAQQVRRVLDGSALSRVFVANHNSDWQTTIAGDLAELGTALTILRNSGARHVLRLNVSGPFHTPLMAPAAEAFTRVVAACEFAEGRVPVISSVTGQPFDHRRAAELLGRQIVGPVEWVRTVQTLRAAGVEQFDEAIGRTLTSLINDIRWEAGR